MREKEMNEHLFPENAYKLCSGNGTASHTKKEFSNSTPFFDRDLFVEIEILPPSVSYIDLSQTLVISFFFLSFFFFFREIVRRKRKKNFFFPPRLSVCRGANRSKLFLPRSSQREGAGFATKTFKTENSKEFGVQTYYIR